jgi:hypothetical protein
MHLLLLFDACMAVRVGVFDWIRRWPKPASWIMNCSDLLMGAPHVLKRRDALQDEVKVQTPDVALTPS